jgi:hypothetical protein
VDIISHRHKPGLAASIANIHYDNALIRDIYWPDGDLCGYPANPSDWGSFDVWTGVAGTYPAYLFMYADITAGTEPPTPQPSTIGRSARWVRYS